MVNKFFTILLVLISSNSINAQDFDNYLNISSEGKVPEEFRKLSSEKYTQDLEQISSSEKRSKRKAQEQFYLESNFLLDELLLSGKVLINDPLGKYVNKVADEVLKQEPDLRNKLRFYIVRSGSVNAFATDNGAIFINMGLLAKMENEAQLAFVLSHEISHYVEKHSINRYVTNEEIDKSRAYKKTSLEEKLMTKSLFSKDQEQESDLEGMKLFLKTAYHPAEMMNALLFLKSADVPMKEFELSSKNFNDQLYEWPDKYHLDTLVPMEEVDEEIVYSTHPSIEKRVEVLNENLKNKNIDSGEKFIIASEAEFNLLRKIAAYETAFIFLQNAQFPEAIYLANVLQSDNPNSIYLKYILARSYYGLLRAGTNTSTKDLVNKPENTMPTMQRLHYFLRELDRKDITAFALKNTWDIYKIKNDKETQLMFEDALRIYVDNDWMRNKSSNKKSASKDSTEIRERYLDVVTAYLESESEYQEILSKVKKNNKSKTIKGKSKGRGTASKTKSILLLDPLYIKLDERKDQQVKFIASEKKQKELTETIESCAKKAGVTVNILSPYDLNEDNMELYSEIALMKDYFNYLDGEEKGIVPLQYDKVNEILNKYNADKVGIAGVVGLRQKKAGKAAIVILSAMMIYTLPMGILYAVLPEYDSFSFLYLYDFENNNPAFERVHYMDFKDSDAAIKSSLYYNFLQVKKGKK